MLSNHSCAWQCCAVLNYLFGACFAIIQTFTPQMVIVDQLGVLFFVAPPLALHHRVLRLCEQNRMRHVLALIATLLDSTTTDLECNPDPLPFQLLQSIFDVGQSDQ